MTTNRTKHLIVLVGPKGAGKSTIGDFLSRELGIHFVRVEPFFLAVRAKTGATHPDYERLGFEAARAGIEDALRDHDVVCFESTGASAYASPLLEDLARVARVSIVRVIATGDQCVERIATRDTSIHIPVSDHDVDRINAIAARVSLPWSAEIDNRGDFPADSIREIIGKLIAE